MFHVLQLKKALGPRKMVEPVLPPLFKRFEWVTEHEEVHGYRKNPVSGEWEVSIAWKSLAAHDATWKIVEIFAGSFLCFTLRPRWI